MGSALKLLISLLAGALACAGIVAAGYRVIGHERLGMFMFYTGGFPMIGPLVGLAIAVPVVLCVLMVGFVVGRGAYSFMDRSWPTPPLGALRAFVVFAVFLCVVAAPFYFAGISDDRGFAKLCSAAETTFLRAPSQPVGSIAHDWDPRWHRDAMAFVWGTRGNISATGFAAGLYGDDIGFVEFPVREMQPGSTRFVRVTRGEYKSIPIPAITADVLVRYDASDYAELQKAPNQQGALRYSLSVTDRRDGQVLATMTYLYEGKAARACGANKSSDVDEGEFVRRAIRPR
jgi:hypothetical protein